MIKDPARRRAEPSETLAFLAGRELRKAIGRGAGLGLLIAAAGLGLVSAVAVAVGSPAVQ